MASTIVVYIKKQVAIIGLVFFFLFSIINKCFATKSKMHYELS